MTGLKASNRTKVPVSSLIPNDFSIFIPFDSLLVRWEHWIGLLSLFEEAALPAPLALHHQIVMLGFHCNRLIQVIFHVALVAGIHIHPTNPESELNVQNFNFSQEQLFLPLNNNIISSLLQRRSKKYISAHLSQMGFLITMC